MVSVQRSIAIRVPVHALYDQLTQFEEYPRFMHGIESVEQRDDTHLHWKARMMDQAIEWDATITECVPDRCIAWQSESGPGNAGKVELQSVGPAASRLTFTLVSEMEIEPSTPAGDIKAELSERVWEDLTRLRALVEGEQQEDHSEHTGMHDSGGLKPNSKEFSGQETGPVAEIGISQGTGRDGNTAGRTGLDEVATLGSVEGTAQGATDEKSQSTQAPQATQAQRSIESLQRDRGSPGNPVPTSGFAAGSEGFSGDEDPSSPVVSASHVKDQNRGAAGSGAGEASMQASELSRKQQGKSMLSDYSLSRGTEDGMQEGRDSIAEEVSFDQQSDFARHVGQLSSDKYNDENKGTPNTDVIAKAAQRKPPEPEV
jgi:ribosome-associated toxin RatA of RatAB toxin-antitoxin module